MLSESLSASDRIILVLFIYFTKPLLTQKNVLHNELFVFIQTGRLPFVREQLYLSSVSAEIQPLTSKRTRPEL